MPTLLRIDSSSRITHSQSRRLADLIEAGWSRQHSNGVVLRRDLASQALPHISEQTIAGFYTPPEQFTPELTAATALSDQLIAEFMGADALLISVSMYNFSIPSALKAYIDQVVRAGRTFGITPERGLFGLVGDKPTYIAAAYGAAGYFGGALGSLNYLEPYLRSLLGFLGVQNLRFISVEGGSVDPAVFEASRIEAEKLIAGLFAAAV